MTSVPYNDSGVTPVLFRKSDGVTVHHVTVGQCRFNSTDWNATAALFADMFNYYATFDANYTYNRERMFAFAIENSVLITVVELIANTMLPAVLTGDTGTIVGGYTTAVTVSTNPYIPQGPEQTIHTRIYAHMLSYRAGRSS